MEPIFVELARRGGVHFMGASNLRMQTPESIMALAMDAQPSLITLPNAGIPAFLTTNIDPKVIDVLFAPMKAAEIVGDEVKKGDWTSSTEMFIFVENTGETASYGDFSNNGRSDANINFPQRRTITRRSRNGARGNWSWPRRLASTWRTRRTWRAF